MSDFLITLITYFTDALTKLLTWLFDLLLDTLLFITLPLLYSIGELIPDNLNSYIESAILWLNYLDTWLPVSLALTLFLVYAAIEPIIYLGKFIISHIPFIN